MVISPLLFWAACLVFGAAAGFVVSELWSLRDVFGGMFEDGAGRRFNKNNEKK